MFHCSKAQDSKRSQKKSTIFTSQNDGHLTVPCITNGQLQKDAKPASKAFSDGVLLKGQRMPWMSHGCCLESHWNVGNGHQMAKTPNATLTHRT